MAYFGTTSPSSQANPPKLLIGPLAANPFIPGSTMFLTTQGSTATNDPNAPGGTGCQLWSYVSTNETTDVTASNFFSDGSYLGMRSGDFVMGAWFTSQGSSAIAYLGVITSVSTAGANLTVGTLTSTN